MKWKKTNNSPRSSPSHHPHNSIQTTDISMVSCSICITPIVCPNGSKNFPEMSSCTINNTTHDMIYLCLKNITPFTSLFSLFSQIIYTFKVRRRLYVVWLHLYRNSSRHTLSYCHEVNCSSSL